MEDFLSKPKLEILEIVREYMRLSLISTLSEEEATRLSEILELAINNTVLDFWINNIDYCVGYLLDLFDVDSLNSYQDQQALLREYIGILTPPDTSYIIDKSEVSCDFRL